MQSEDTDLIRKQAMVAIEHFISPASLPLAPAGVAAARSLSICSWNVLLPNSVDGWWNYKMYHPPLDTSTKHVGEWEHRSEIIRKRLELINADVVCLQEVSPKSFEEDFAFMADLDYDGVELFRKGRFRPATFWRKSVVDLAAPPVHKDRTLLTTFRHVNAAEGDAEEEAHNFHVLNCHLQAGKNGGRRVRQVHEGVGASVKLARKLKEKDPTSPLLIVCGDFNGGPECGAVRYLEDGSIGPELMEDGESVTSKEKKISTSAPLMDVAASLEREAPPTLVVPELISLMIEGATEDAYRVDTELSADVLERLERAYYSYATHEDGGQKVMGVSDVEKWLTDINGQVGRGSEFRRAAREMGYVDPPEVEESSESGGENQKPAEKPRITIPEDSILSLEGFQRVYLGECREGKFWGIAYDLSVMGQPLPDAGTFSARFDRLYCSQALRPTAVLDTISEVACPNLSEPSDHLPVCARLEIC